MSLHSKLYILLTRQCFKTFTRKTFLGKVGTSKAVNSITPLSKLFMVFKPSKYMLQSKIYQRVFKFSLKTSRKGMLISIAFFGPSILFSEDQLKGSTVESVIQVNEQDSYNQLINKSRTLLFYIYESVCVVLRFLRLFCTFVPIFLLYPITYFGHDLHSLWWKILLAGIEFSGPIFIKFGQWASTRRDLFPEVCCNQFSRLQRRSKPHSWHYTKQQLVKAFGKDWRKMFVKIDNNSNPIGSGCIAQVYKVWMNEEYIKNEILDEIITESEDFEDDHMGFLDDGLEVWGFRQFMRSRKQELEEEKTSLKEYHKTRMMVEESAEEDNQTKGIISDIKGLTEELADEIMVLGLKPWLRQGKEENAYEREQKTFTEWGELEEEDVGVKDTEDLDQIDDDNDHLEHALVEQWQATAGVLEKALPTSEEDLDNLEGLVPVALKVLHPRVYRTFKRDISIFRMGARILNVLWPPLQWLSLEQCVDEFFEVMEAQIDLRTEANNLDVFIETFAAVDTVRFPRPVRPYVTRRILTETFEEGEPIAHFITDSSKSEAIRKNLARIGVDTLLKMIFIDNFIHGDLHPGNILVQHDTTSAGDGHSHDGNTTKYSMVDIGGDTFVMAIVEDPNPLRICLLDCGIVAKLKQNDLNNLKAVFHQVIVGNGKAVADLFLEHSDHHCQNPENFRTDMSQLVQSARQNAISLEQVDVGILLQRVLGLLLQHRIRLESAFSAVVLAVFVLEGLGRSLDPEMDILERARPMLAP